MRALLGLLLASFASAQPPAGGAAAGGVPLGQRVYLARCAACHGEDGRGGAGVAGRAQARTPDALDLTSERLLREDDAALARGIQTGHGGMKGFGARLSAPELAAVVAYIRALGHARAGSDSGVRQARGPR